MNNVLKARCSHVKEWACVLRGQFVSKNSWLQIIVITSIGSWILMQDYSCCILNIIKILMDKLFMLRPQYWMERQGSHCWTSQLQILQAPRWVDLALVWKAWAMTWCCIGQRTACIMRDLPSPSASCQVFITYAIYVQYILCYLD